MFSSFLSSANSNRPQAPRNHKATRRLTLEGLESRQVMAGNVVAGMVAGSLNLTGDFQSNQVELHQLGVGIYKVEGLGGTTINGMPSQVFGGVVGNINCNMNFGDDRVLIDEIFSTPANLNVDMGLGNDLVQLYGTSTAPIKVQGHLNVLTGQGADHVRMTGLTVVGNGIIDTGTENDGIGAYQLVVGGSLGLLTRAGDDSVLLSRTRVGGATRIATEAGNDLLRIDSGSDFGGSFSADMGDGNDAFRLSDTVFRDLFTFQAGWGNDKVDLLGKIQFLKPATFQMGMGDDTVAVAATASINNAANLTFDGGLGFDSIADAPGNYTNPALVTRVSFP
jgi:hypothetical protein